MAELTDDTIRHFLVTKRFGRLERVDVFDDMDEAIRAYEKAERACDLITVASIDELPVPAECVLLGADRLATCVTTHGVWFDEPTINIKEWLPNA